MSEATDVLFSFGEVQRLTGITERQLDYWCRVGVICPAVPANGSGSRRAFDVREVNAIRVFAVVLNLGLGTSRACRPPSSLATLVEHVRAHGATGTYEYAPGVLLDLEVLAGEPVPATTGGGA